MPIDVENMNHLAKTVCNYSFEEVLGLAGQPVKETINPKLPLAPGVLIVPDGGGRMVRRAFHDYEQGDYKLLAEMACNAGERCGAQGAITIIVALASGILYLYGTQVAAAAAAGFALCSLVFSFKNVGYSHSAQDDLLRLHKITAQKMFVKYENLVEATEKELDVKLALAATIVKVFSDTQSIKHFISRDNALAKVEQMVDASLPTYKLKRREEA